MLAVPLVFAVLGLFLGPSLHHLGVRAAVRRPFDGIVARCAECEAVRRWPYRLHCFSCSAPIRRREPLIWLVSMAGTAGAAAVAGWSWLLPSHLMLALLTTILVVTDLDEKIIPNRLLYPGTAVAVVLLAIGGGIDGRLADVGRGALAGVGYFAILWVVAAVTRGGFGMGDVKLAVVLGMFMGFWGWPVLASGLFFTGMIGGLPALWMIATRRAGRNDELPYGPAMIFGAWTALVAGGPF